MKKIDHRCQRRFSRQHGMHLADKGIAEAEIGKHCYHGQNISPIYAKTTSAKNAG